jgi:dTDP-glucose 4,6-dehydratase
MRYVITGHKGFIGSYLTAELESRGHTWHGVDWAGNPSIDLSAPNFFERALRSALAQQKVDAVIHLAAQPGRVFGEEDRAKTIQLNAAMTAEIAAACGKMGVRLIYTSTSEVYGDRPGHALEVATPRPKNLYGLTKLWGEEVSKLYAPERLLILRPTMPYGPGMAVGHGRAALPTFIWYAIKGHPIKVHADAKRSWCYIDDLIRGFADLIEKAWAGGIYNVGRDDDLRTMTEIAVMACKLAGAPTSLIEYEDPDPTITLVKDLAVNGLRGWGFRPQVSLEEGMRRTYEWLMERQERPELTAVR